MDVEYQHLDSKFNIKIYICKTKMSEIPGFLGHSFKKQIIKQVVSIEKTINILKLQLDKHKGERFTGLER